jgi:hypothetical protein
MGFLDGIKKKRSFIKASAMVSITQSGETAADSDTEQGDSYTILAKLSDRSPQSVSSIARESNFDVFRTSRGVEKLAKQGKVNVSDFGANED